MRAVKYYYEPRAKGTDSRANVTWGGGVMAASSNGANLGFERELWQAADALRSNMDAAEYKHVVLGLIFLKYISGS